VTTLAAEGADAVIGRIVNAVRLAVGEAHIAPDDVAAVGVAAPGPIDVVDGVITDPPNLPGWHNVPLAQILRDRIQMPVFLENDANCGAVGEHRFGAGRGYRDMIYVTISTGIGGGIIIDDQLYAGASGAAGEVGHIGVAVTGPVCGAGHVGCLEAFSSGTAIARRAQEMIAAGGLPRTARLAEQNPPLSVEDVYMAGQQGEVEAAALIESAGRYLGIGLASIINAFNPQAIVMGGGLVNMGEAILGPAIETARARSFAQSFSDVRIIEWELGEHGTALGATAVARDRSERPAI
jgi:glucokinase